MNTSCNRNDPLVLQAFLYDLICKVKWPEEVELLVEAVLNIQQPHSIPRSTLSPVGPIDGPAVPNQGRAG